jgi:Domain of unknown function (DUF4124)
MRLVLVVLIGMIIASAAWGAVYEWVDSKGVVNMTDDPDKVPAAYRKTMKSRDIDTREQVPPARDTHLSPAGSYAGSATQTGNYGGKDEQWWRSSFKSARSDIKRLQEQIEADKKSLEELHHRRVAFQKPSDRVEYFRLEEQNTREEGQLTALQEILANLGNRADSAGVPLGWRE